ncbi:Deoxyguanosinetriphosphate triphosphohydrolase [Vibrio aerogenes CECT 7868]|uniref:Probable deoxyguanosinetriphosphate triphosphohydrolase n=2 Tax=Vibrio aerogenes TaxID=92172 RepID=A0A1M5YWN4_9VIBR|nr:Deoxyguanosinetriphosphate triphosphohydrolase [Vibrio aerogenes CECT 7868]
MQIDFRARFRYNRPYTSGSDNTSRIEPYRTGQIPRLSQFESDRGRIINSAAIRRLQQKTQVFPLERNSSVRSRLTHSLEVQQVGRHIVQRIYHQLGEDAKQYGLEELERHFESVVEMGCLMHDVGNPPFGHFGEQAINDWFCSYEGIKALPPALYKDLTEFEGNAQAIRLVHSILSLNLTYTQVSAILKYTRRGDELSPKTLKQRGTPMTEAELPYLKKKVGFYLSEDEFIGNLYQTLALEKGTRAPFTYIMEAADDISYGIADIEDAVEKGILDRKRTSEALCQEYQNLLMDPRYAGADPEKMAQIVHEAQSRATSAKNCAVSHFFITLRVEISQLLPRHAATQFIENIETIYTGRFNRPLIENFSTEHALVETLKNVAKKHAFCDRDVEARELQGYKIITGLLDYYKPLLELERDDFLQVKEGDRTQLLPSRLFSKLPGKHLRAYDNAMKDIEAGNYPGGYEFSAQVWEYYYRVRLIQDYISGMTDQYAFDEYRAFSVIDSL